MYNSATDELVKLAEIDKNNKIVQNENETLGKYIIRLRLQSSKL